MKLFINILSFFILMVKVNMITSCAYRLSKEEINNIKEKEHAFLLFNFNAKSKCDYAHWDVKIYINDKLIINDRFAVGEKYRIPVTTGKLIIKYSLQLNCITKIFKTGSKFYELPQERKIEYNISKNNILVLNITDVGIPKTKYICLYPMPLIFPKKLQEVEFETELQE